MLQLKMNNQILAEEKHQPMFKVFWMSVNICLVCNSHQAIFEMTAEGLCRP